MRPTLTTTNRRTAAGWPVFVVLYAALTVWIFVGRQLAPEPTFAALKNAGYVVAMIVGVWAFRDGFVRSWRTTKQRPLLAAGMVVVGLALMGVASAVGVAAALLAGPAATGANQAAISAEALTASTSLVGALLFVGLGGVVAPVVEELAFRELPLGRFRELLSTRTAFLLSCLVFGLIHLRGWNEWPLAILYVGYAAALASTYLLSKRNLLVSIAAHALWNGTGLVYLLVTAA